MIGTAARPARLLVAADGATRRVAVHDRHLAIHQDRVMGAGTRRDHRLRAILRQLDHAAETFQDRRRDLAVDGVVFGDQDAWRAPARLPARTDACSPASGPAWRAARCRNQKVEPRPSSLSKPTSPPIRCASSRMITNPSPVPPKRRVVELSACENGANSFAAAAGADADAGVAHRVAQPALVDGSPAAAPAAHSQVSETAIVPRSVNLTAFVSRLLTICRMRNGIAEHRRRHVGADDDRQQHPLRRRRVHERLRHLLDQPLRAERDVLQIEPPGLDLRQVENVVQQMQQRLRRLPQRPE
jgi:hypothetical protein